MRLIAGKYGNAVTSMAMTVRLAITVISLKEQLVWIIYDTLYVKADRWCNSDTFCVYYSHEGGFAEWQLAVTHYNAVLFDTE